ncbi:15230_t:CDS:1, partial [Gigaspora rosea]
LISSNNNWQISITIANQHTKNTNDGFYHEFMKNHFHRYR